MLQQQYIVRQWVNLQFFWKKVYFAKWNDEKCRKQQPRLWIWKPYCSEIKTGGIAEKAEPWFLEFWDWITFCNLILWCCSEKSAINHFWESRGREALYVVVETSFAVVLRRREKLAHQRARLLPQLENRRFLLTCGNWHDDSLTGFSTLIHVERDTSLEERWNNV